VVDVVDGLQTAPAKVMGYWAPAATYSSRLATVGPAGVKARRIYGNLTTAGNDTASQITATIAAGMLPIVSYKLNGSLPPTPQPPGQPTLRHRRPPPTSPRSTSRSPSPSGTSPPTT
jgi:hypothetical protein